MRPNQIMLAVALVFTSVVSTGSVDAQQVFSNSRPQASANRPGARTATGTFSTGNRFQRGVRSNRFSFPSPATRIPNRYGRSTSVFGPAIQSPVFNNTLSGSTNYSTGVYYSRPNRIQRRNGVASFSGPGYYNPYVPGYNGVAVGGVFVNGGRFGNQGQFGVNPIFYVDPVAGPTFSPYVPGYPWVPNGQIPFGVYAPPILVPYLNIGPGLTGLNGFSTSSAFQSFPAAGFVNQSTVTTQTMGPSVVATPSMIDVVTSESAPALPIDDQPIVNEFPGSGPPTDTIQTAAVDRIRSIRYQASGDVSFREGDFASAEALYRNAAEAAGDRQAPWLRLMLSQILQSRYPEAVRSLKSGLNRNDDPTAAWVDAKTLTSSAVQDDIILAEEQLYQWLKQRPNSTDRLLLTAAFSEYQGAGSAARELLQLGQSIGLDQTLVSNLKAVTEDYHRPDNDKRREPIREDVREPVSAPALDSFSDADIDALQPKAEAPAKTRSTEEAESSKTPEAPVEIDTNAKPAAENSQGTAPLTLPPVGLSP